MLWTASIMNHEVARPDSVLVTRDTAPPTVVTPRRILLIILAATIVTGVALATVCGVHGCSSREKTPVEPDSPVQPIPLNTDDPSGLATDSPMLAAPVASREPTRSPVTTARPTLTLTPTMDYNVSRAVRVTEYINRITLSDRILVYMNSSEATPAATPEELALQWLIEQDPLPLSPHHPVHQFRLTQRYALQTLLVQRSNWVPLIANGSLNSSTSECDWDCITCQLLDMGGRIGTVSAVTEINCTKHFWGGHISFDLGLLSTLIRVELQHNDLRGTLPGSIGRWTNLVRFVVGLGNRLTGTLPASIGNLTRLEMFDGTGNQFSGTLPESMAHWTNLKYFCVYQFYYDRPSFNGTLPEWLGQWSRLEYFDVRGNRFTGTLPDSIRQWTNLKLFAAYNNRLQGTLPESIGTWSDLIYFEIDFNHFSGTLPASIGTWENLEYFFVYNNTFHGTVPEPAVKWTRLTKARLMENNFTGSVPIGICRLTNLVEIQVDCGEVDCACDVCSCIYKAY